MSNFPEGIRIYKPNAGAPDFVKGQIVLQKEELQSWLRDQTDQVRMDIKESREGKLYLAINTYSKPKEDTSNLPF